jgi:SAM-dependent methyltransferase
MSDEGQRKPHAVLDLPSRRHKAMKIERLLELDSQPGPCRLLEIGAGSGGVSAYFANHPSGRYQVDAVDVKDGRLVDDGYRFQLVSGTRLPFDDCCFDIVVSNHVIEHVGDDAAQAQHLTEMNRVLRPGGLGYLAVPNRWMLIEPHYRLIFLSWWPESWRSTWLRMWRKESFYDCRPLACGDLERRLFAAGFAWKQLHHEALRLTFEIESPDDPMWRLFLRHVPHWVHQMSRRIYPTLIYRLSRTNIPV